MMCERKNCKNKADIEIKGEPKKKCLPFIKNKSKKRFLLCYPCLNELKIFPITISEYYQGDIQNVNQKMGGFKIISKRVKNEN